MTLATLPLRQVCVVKPGFAFKSSDLSDVGIPVVKIGSITDTGTVDLESGQFLPEALVEERHERFFLNSGDVVLGMTGEGKIGRIRNDQRGLLNQRVCKLSTFDTLDQNYLWLAIRTVDYTRVFAQLAQGAAQANISGSQIEALEIPWPEKRHRIRITGILSAYDDLIENNRQRIALLEEAARLLYREWFVHFRFPGHEHVKVIDGLPEGWARKSLVSLAEIIMGQSPRSRFYNDHGVGIPFHQGVTDYGFRFVSDRIYSSSTTKLAMPGDILVSVRAPVGRINITRNKIVLGRGLAALRSRTAHQSFVFYALKDYFYAEDIIGSGSIYAATNKKELENQEFIEPSPRLLGEFEDQVNPIDDQILCLSNQNEKLMQARDLLLPRLMSGEIAA